MGKLIVISGPTGSGKTTVCDRLLEEMPDLQYSISFTTRSPRKGEKEGRDYFFIEKEQFEKRIQEGKFLEYAQVFDNYYGTDKDWVNEILEQGKNVLLCIDVQGANQVKKNFEDAILIFLMPPDFEELGRRLRGRGTDGEDQIKKRLDMAKEEMAQVSNYNYMVVNDKLKDSVSDIVHIIKG